MNITLTRKCKENFFYVKKTFFGKKEIEVKFLVSRVSKLNICGMENIILDLSQKSSKS